MCRVSNKVIRHAVSDCEDGTSRCTAPVQPNGSSYTPPSLGLESQVAMPHGFSRRAPVRACDPAHAHALAPAAPVLIPILVLLSLLLLPGILRAQARATMQVAATILRVEPSRTALGVAMAAVDQGRTTSRSKLAQVHVDSARATAQRPRVVRIDFLRN